MQECKTCAINKPKKDFHTTGKNKTLKKECKDCVNKKRREARKENPDKYRQQDQKSYTKHKDKVIAKSKIYYQNNKESILKHCKDSYDKEKVKIKNKNYYENNKEELLSKVHTYYEENKEKICAQKKEYRKSINGRLSIRNGRQNRRIKEKEAADGTITKESLKNLDKMQNSQCYYCKTTIDIQSPLTHLDHLTPLSKGGLHSITNVAWTCAACNLKKNNKTEEEFKCQLQLTMTDQTS